MKTFTVVPKLGKPFDILIDTQNASIQSKVVGEGSLAELVTTLGYSGSAIFRNSEIIGVYEKVEPSEEES